MNTTQNSRPSIPAGERTAGTNVATGADYGDPRLPARIWVRLHPEPNTGCWLWSGSLVRGGYGATELNGRRWVTHRLTYETLVAAVPAGAELDHLCRMRDCANPAHLEVVSHAENMARSVPRTTRIAPLATACASGHDLTAESTYLHRRTGRRPTRVCRACERERDAKRRQQHTCTPN